MASRSGELASGCRWFFTRPLRGRVGSLSTAQCETGRGDRLSSSVVFQWERFSFASTIQLDVNSFHHRVEIAAYIRIPEANDFVALLLQPSLPFAIALGRCILVMMPAVELDDQTFRRTQEVHDVGPIGACRRKCLPSIGSSFSARQRMRSCGVVLARSFFAAARRIAVETITISLAERSPHPALSRLCRLKATLPLQGRV